MLKRKIDCNRCYNLRAINCPKYVIQFTLVEFRITVQWFHKTNRPLKTHMMCVVISFPDVEDKILILHL
jgi:hypothetical protein